LGEERESDESELYYAGVKCDGRIMTDDNYRKELMSKLRAEIEQKSEEKIIKHFKDLTAAETIKYLKALDFINYGYNIETVKSSKDFRECLIKELHIKRITTGIKEKAQWGNMRKH
jgi:predicted house-cleaning noncanonical NTP pyrophosphatase (MazG superfamily)